MPIETIPVLEQDFALFDWNDHPHSYMALVKDVLFSNFKKEAWYGVVDKLNDALLAAGMEWDNAYTTVRGAMDGYNGTGEFEAEMFNSVRHNIDQIAPTGWRWANDPTFRGYVGREDFRGYRYYGKNSDLVYPEYIKELVRKLNLVIDIMKDNGNTTDAEHQSNSSTLFLQGLIRKPSKPIAYESISASIVLPGLVSKPSKPIAVEGKSASLFLQGLIRKPSRPMDADKCKIATLHESTLLGKMAARLDGNSELMHTLSTSEMDVWKSLPVSGSGTAESISAAQCADVPSFPVIGSAVSKSTQSVDVTAAESSPIQATHLGKTTHKGEILPREPFGVVGADKSTTEHSATPDTLIVSEIVASGKSKSGTSASIDSAWYPPIWVDGVLWVRQTINNRQMDDILHIDETPDLAVAECSESIIFAQLDSAWLPPVMDGDTLHIRQAYETTQTENELGVM